MDANEQVKLTLVTYPDFYMESAKRAVVIGNYRFRVDLQDHIGVNWPAQDLTLYPCEGKAEKEMEWLAFQLSIADIVFVEAKSHWDWVWPLLTRTQADKFFFGDFDGINYTPLEKSLNLTYPGKIFNTIEAMVSRASYLHT